MYQNISRWNNEAIRISHHTLHRGRLSETRWKEQKKADKGLDCKLPQLYTCLASFTPGVGEPLVADEVVIREGL